jgi:LETM1 and EF-hand domain-containing protein 1
LLAPQPSSAAKDVATASAEKDSKAISTEKAKGTRMQRIWATVKKEALHYWHGTKLLGKEIRISARIQGKLLAGKKLTRREHRQVRRVPCLRVEGHTLKGANRSSKEQRKIYSD